MDIKLNSPVCDWAIKTSFYKLTALVLEADADPETGAIDRVFYFPDSTPTKTENARFFVVLGDDVLDEDGVANPQDEIYGKLILAHKLFQTVNGKTNIAKIYA